MFLATTLEQPTPLVTASLASSTALSIEWQQAYRPTGGGVYDLRLIIQTSDGGYALSGMGMSIIVGGIAPMIVKVDALGNQQWVKGYFDEKNNVELGGANSIVQTADGGYALSGGSYLYKIDSEGSLQWRKSYANVNALSLVKTDDGGFVLAGNSGGQCWVTKVDSNGEILWSHTFGGKNAIGPLPISIVQTRDGGYAIASNVNASGSGYTAWMIKTDSLGNMLWNRTYDDPLRSFNCFSLLATKDGGYALAGETASRLVSLTKTDSGGGVLWNQTYGDLGNQAAFSVIETSDGGFALGCGWNSGSLIKTNSVGQLQWEIPFNSTVYSVVQTSNGDYVVLGNGGNGNWLAKTAISTSTSTSSPSPSPTTTVPEFPWAVIAFAVVITASTLAFCESKIKKQTCKSIDKTLTD